jgi:glyoxylase-like metal-dependent hydrolase (beta-lactamase superfamily II)
VKIYPIEAGNFKLDGGAMFGVVPKSLWQKTNPSDSNNMIDMASRCMLIEDKNKLVLIDSGMGNKQSEKFFSYYFKWGGHDLVSSINAAGFSCDEISDVLFTHLHFDHCGGGIVWDVKKSFYKPLFKNANYWSSQNHWNWATKSPNPREKASFLKENLDPIESSGALSFVSEHEKGFEYKKNLGFEVLFVNGHTEKQMIPKITYKGKSLVFAADLLPTAGHVPVPYVMGYDVRPLVSMSEKELFLKEAVDKNYYLFLEHDPHNQIITLKNTEKGVRIDKTFTFDEIFN